MLAWAKSHRDLVRILLLVVFGLGLLFSDLDSANMIWVYAAGAGIFLALVSHVTRRIMFNKLDLQSIALKAAETPLGASLVFVGICAVLISLMWIPVIVVR